MKLLHTGKSAGVMRGNEFDEAESQRRAAGAVSAAATPSSGTFNREHVEKK